MTIVDAFSNVCATEPATINVYHHRERRINNSIYPILCAIVKERRANNIATIINFELPENCSQLRYAERMNFLRHLEINYSNPQIRHRGAGRFIELTNFPMQTRAMPPEFGNIFRNDFNFTEKAAQDLKFTLGELIANTSMHSGTSTGCFLYAQKYPTAKALTIYLVDNGVGIRDSLRTNEQYAGISNEDAIQRALEFEVGDGEGYGHGLYIVSEFIKRNSFTFAIVSGDNHILIDNGKQKIGNNNYYQGVLIKLVLGFKVTTTIDDIYDSID